MQTTDSKVLFKGAKVMLRKVSISLLLGLMVVTSFAFTPSASANPVNGNEWESCGDENDYCSFDGEKEVRFGVDGQYYYKTFTEGVDCDIDTFGDPSDGEPKECYIRDVVAPVNHQTVPQTALNQDGKEVTVTFANQVAQAVSLDDLKNAISIKRSSAQDYSSLDPGDSVIFQQSPNGPTVKVTLSNALVGNNNWFKIESGALWDTNSDTAYAEGELGPIVGVSAVVYTGSYMDNDSRLNLEFNKNLTINNPNGMDESTYLKSQISIAVDGEHFVPLQEQSNIWKNNNRITIQYDFGVKIVQGLNTRIKIAGGALKDDDGNPNEELTLRVTPPVLQTAEISNHNHDVTITFQGDIFDATLQGVTSNLKQNIYVLRDGNSSQWISLTANDTITVQGKTLVIHLAQALTGANNRVVIGGNVLKDSYGNVQRDESSTPIIQAIPQGEEDPNPDVTAPQLIDSYISNSNHDIVFVFDEDVQNNVEDAFVSTINIRKNVYMDGYWQWRWVALDVIPVVEFSGRTITLHFADGVIYNQYKINAGSIKDRAGNVKTDDIYTNSMGTISNLYLQYGSISHDGHWLNLRFNSNSLKDLTLANGVSSLNSKITISTDGTNYNSLDQKDVVSIQQNRLVIVFHNPKQSGTVKIKIAADVLGDTHNNARNTEIDEVIGYNTPDVTGYLFSDATSELTFADNESWRTKISEVGVYDDNNEVTRTLNSSEYTISAGKLTIKPGVFQKGTRNYVYIYADGYSTKDLYSTAVKSSELFYMTAPTISTAGGLTAKINVVSTNTDTDYFSSYGTQSVVFELMNGDTPVSIVAADLKVVTGTYKAIFNVSDAVQNPNYTVRAFIVNKFDTDSASVGSNMATVLTQPELDLKQIQLEVELY